MKIKRFIAPTMRDAIRLVREEQGADAVILSNRRVEGGVEVVAATDYDAALVQTAALRSEPAPSAPVVFDVPELQPAPVAREAVAEVPVRTPEPVLKFEMPAAAPVATDDAPRIKPVLVQQAAPAANSRAATAASSESNSARDPSYIRYLLRNEPVEAAAGASRPAVAARPPLTPPRLEPERPAPVVAKPVAVAAPAAQVVPTRDTRPASIAEAAAAALAPRPGSEMDSIRNEMQSMRRFMEQQLGGLAWNDLKTRNPVRADVVRTLTNIGLELRIAREIATELPDDATQERARFLPMGLLARRIPAFKHEWLDAGGVISLVGPTGVGKTTTIAKLAARYVQNWGLRDVALVTTDHYRIGAQEQLFTYGRLLGVPVLTADNERELALALDKLRACKLVLIDTAGMSPRDSNLEKQFATLNGVSAPIRTALVMSAASQGADLDDQFKRFAPAKPGAVILTKLDEASRVGAALSAVIRHEIPLAYVTDGQRVPEDLSAARPDQLVLRAMQLARKSAEPVDEDELSFQFSGAAAHA